MGRKPLNAGFTGEVTEKEGVSAKARVAARRVRDEAGTVTAYAADHPAASGSAVIVVGLLGFAAGYMLGASAVRSRYWH